MHIISVFVDEDMVMMEEYHTTPEIKVIAPTRQCYLELDHRRKAPRSHLAKRTASKVNLWGDSGSLLVVNFARPKFLLWNKVLKALQNKTIGDLRLLEADSAKQLAQRLARKIRQADLSF